MEPSRIKRNDLKISLLEYIPIPLFFIDKDHRITFWNRACEELTGYMAKDMEGSRRQWLPFYSQERPLMADLIIEQDIEGLRRYYENKNLRASGLIPGAYEAEDFFPNLGGKDRYLRFLAAPVWDEEGKILGAIVTLQDITRLVKLEEEARRYTGELEQGIWDKMRELRLSEDRYQRVIRSCREGIAIIQEGEIKWANPKFQEIFGYGRDEILHLNLAKLVDPEWKMTFLNQFHQGAGLELNEYQNYEFKGLRKDGSTIFLESNLTHFFYGLRLANMLFVWDITEQKRFQFLLNQAREEKARAMARDLHDGVGQHLLSIHVNLEALKSKLSLSRKSNIGKELSYIDQAIENATEEIRRIAMDLRPPLLDKLGFIPALKEIIQSFSLATGIQIEYFLPDRTFSLPKSVEINLLRILQEALNNISRHAQSPKALVIFDLFKDKLLVAIKDFGKGFLPDELYAKKDRKGVGLLTLAERVRIINGQFNIRSKPECGTTLYIEIPI
jgi:PAS domain S-box-containing protein